jgi:hypothetical protein
LQVQSTSGSVKPATCPEASQTLGREDRGTFLLVVGHAPSPATSGPSHSSSAPRRAAHSSVTGQPRHRSPPRLKHESASLAERHELVHQGGVGHRMGVGGDPDHEGRKRRRAYCGQQPGDLPPGHNFPLLGPHSLRNLSGACSKHLDGATDQLLDGQTLAPTHPCGSCHFKHKIMEASSRSRGCV